MTRILIRILNVALAASAMFYSDYIASTVLYRNYFTIFRNLDYYV